MVVSMENGGIGVNLFDEWGCLDRKVDFGEKVGRRWWKDAGEGF